MVTAMNMAAISGEYRTEFSITEPNQDENPLFGRVCDFVCDCFERLPGDKEAMEETGEFEELAYRRFLMTLPHGRNPDFQVRLNVKLSTRGGPVTVAVQSEFTDKYKPAPPELIAGPPRLVLELFKAFDCYNGPDRLSALPVQLAPETANGFANRIFDPSRRLPILAVSENWRGQLPINPNWLQQLLAGMAEIVTYGSDTADELRRHVGFQLSPACFNGAIRIYQPGCSRDDRREQHKFSMPSDASALLRRPAGRVVQELVHYLPESSDAREFENVRGQVQQRRMTELAAERLAFPLRERIGELESEIDSLRQELQKREIDTASGLAELHNLHQQLVTKDSELDDLRSQLEQAIHREAEYEPEIARLHQQQTERDKRIEFLRQQLESAISEAGAGESEFAQIHNQLLERDGEIDSLWKELETASHKEAEAEQEVARLHAQIRESDAQAELLRQQLHEASSEAGASRYAVEQLRASLQEREDELRTLRGQLEEFSKRSEESAHLVSELIEGIKVRDADIASLRQLLEGVEDGRTAPEGIIAELRRELQEREEGLRAINSLLEDARLRTDAAESAAGELRRELERHLAESPVIVNIMQEYKIDLAETRAEVANVRNQIDKLNVEVSRLNQQLRQAEDKELNDAIAIEELEGTIREKNDVIRVKNARIRHLEDQLDQLDGREQAEPYPFDAPEISQKFDNVHEAVELAHQNFDKLNFLDSAYKTAEDYPFLRPEQVYRAFSLLQELAVAFSKGPLGTNYT